MRLRTIILITLFLFGFLPLFVAVSLNLPTVLAKLETAAQEKQLSLLRQEFLVLSNFMQKQKETLRVFSVNPGSKELASSTKGKVPIPVIRKRLGSMMVDWYQENTDIIHIYIMDQDGQLQLKIDRHEDGLLKLAPASDLKKCPNENYIRGGMALAPGNVFVAGIHSNPQQQSANSPIIIQLAVPVEARKGKSKGIAAIEFVISLIF